MIGGRAKGYGEGVGSTVERRTARGVTREVRSGAGREVAKEMRSGGGCERGSEMGVKCNALILSVLHKRGVSKTDTPLLCKGLYFNILHFTLEIESRAGTAVGGTAAEGKDGGEALGDEGSAERGNWFFRHRPEK